jgi:Flp pilus assembly protein TadG
MLHRPLRSRRPGAITLEAALVYPILLMLTLGVIVFGLGVSRYQQVASLAREGARLASVQGQQYQKTTGKTAATQDSITTYIKSQAVGFDKTKLKVMVSWSPDNNTSHLVSGQMVQNTVTVTVSYTWSPEVYGSAVTLTSTSVMPMSF